MDINQVQFGASYSIANSRPEAKKEEAKAQTEAKQAPSAQPNVDADSIFEAMNLEGLYFQSQIKQTQSKEINPADYLSEDRMADIEAAMAEFESKTGDIAQVISEEFGSAMPTDKAYELAAQIYAGE